jgi:hypothetical protein
MDTNPVEENPVTRFVLGFAVAVAMMLGGGAVGGAFRYTEIPYGGTIGVAIGAILVFVGFVLLYGRYDAAHE